MKLFSIFLLVCFTLVLTPKTWWHHCKHTVHHSKTEHTHEHTIDDDCPVCDLSLSVFTKPTPLFLQTFHNAPFVHEDFPQSIIFQSHKANQQLRAPPSNRV